MGTHTVQHGDAPPQATDAPQGRGPEVGADDALRESEARFRTLAANSYDMISEWDSAGRCLYASPNLREMFGYAADSSLSRIGKISSPLNR